MSFSTGALDHVSEGRSRKDVLMTTTTLKAPFLGVSGSPMGAMPSLNWKERLIVDTTPSDARQPQSSDGPFLDSIPSATLSSPQLSSSSPSFQILFSSTVASSHSVDSRKLSDEEDDIAFPSYETWGLSTKSAPKSGPSPKQGDNDEIQLSNLAPVASTFLHSTAHDDEAIKREPSIHVDYLSQEWKEENIWLSRSDVVHSRGDFANRVRLENALWRAWMKAKNHLRTVRPETLHWFKDADATWLYGHPFTGSMETHSISNTVLPSSNVSHPCSFISKGSILKTKSTSAAILKKSQHTLSKTVDDILSIRQSSTRHDRPVLGLEVVFRPYTGNSVASRSIEHALPEFTRLRSSLAYDDMLIPSERKHVLFDEVVRQVQAIELGNDRMDEDDTTIFADDENGEDDDDDDCCLMMAPSRRPGCDDTRSTRHCFSIEAKLISPLPSTTLKYKTDMRESQEAHYYDTDPWANQPERSPPPSQATSGKVRQNWNFLIHNDLDAADEVWQE